MADSSRSTRRIALVVGGVVIAVVLVAAVGFVIYDRPSVVAVDNRFGAVNESSTVVETDIVVHNPNPIGITLEDATTNYTVRLNGVTVARGTDEGIPLSKGNTTIEETTLLDNDDIPEWWVTHIRNGERTRAKVTAHVRTSILGREFTFTRTRTVETHLTDRINTTRTRAVNPTNVSIPLVADPPLYVNETSANWRHITKNRTVLALSTTLYDPSSIPYPISRLEYTLVMNNVTVGHGTTRGSYVIPSEGERTIDGRLVIDNAKLDEWWVSHIEHDQTTRAHLDVTAVVELPNGRTVRLPLEPLARTKTFETDLFGTQNGRKEKTRRPSESHPKNSPINRVSYSRKRTAPPFKRDADHSPRRMRSK